MTVEIFNAQMHKRTNHNPIYSCVLTYTYFAVKNAGLQ